MNRRSFIGLAGAAALGMSAAFVGTVGDDADGRMILEDFAGQGVDTSMVKVRKGATSAIAYLWIEENAGNRSCAWTREGLDELTAENACLHLRDLAINGGDLMAMGIPKGPMIGTILSRLLSEVCDEKLSNTREALFSRAAQLKEQ